MIISLSFAEDGLSPTHSITASDLINHPATLLHRSLPSNKTINIPVQRPLEQPQAQSNWQEPQMPPGALIGGRVFPPGQQMFKTIENDQSTFLTLKVLKQ